MIKSSPSKKMKWQLLNGHLVVLVKSTEMKNNILKAIHFFGFTNLMKKKLKLEVKKLLFQTEKKIIFYTFFPK